jgi:hypothetical protein
MSKPTELIYIGNCQKLIDDFNTCKKTIIKREDIKVKKGTKPIIFTLQEWSYYPVSFECKDNIEGPVGKFIAGNFINYLSGYYGHMIKRRS